MFDQSFSAALCVPTGLPACVNCPFVGMVLTLCFNEERRWWGGGEHLHSWLPEERITAAYYYIKQLGGPHSPQITGDAFPMMTQYGDAYWLQPAQSMLHVFNDVTAQTPVGNFVLQWIRVKNTALREGRWRNRKDILEGPWTGITSSLWWLASFK